MNERLLQFIWQFQYFNKGELACASGEKLEVLHVGQYNTNQGPDFTNAKLRIGNTVWAGTVELHIHTSDWKKHGHQHDRNYKNVVLHVVWEDDGYANEIPVLELKTRVPKILLERYEGLMNASSFIACENCIHSVRDIVWKSWKERLLAERLLRKAKVVDAYLLRNNYHWEEVFWWMLARNFGLKVNADAFESIARSIPLTLLGKQKHQVHQLEAILLGQAGLLRGIFNEDYPRLLQREYSFQQRKHGISPVQHPLHFLRMRPGNFPTVRLAQLAMLIHHSNHLFSRIRDAQTIKDIRQWFDVTANEYWHYHYRFDETSTFKKKKLGMAMTDTIIINTIAPVLFAYGYYHRELQYQDKALQWLQDTPPENNGVVSGFEKIGISASNACDSQALLELKHEYCDKKNCLDCAVGNSILRSGCHPNS